MVGNTTGLKIHYIIIISILQRSSKLIEKNYESICDTNFKNRQNSELYNWFGEFMLFDLTRLIKLNNENSNF